MNKVNKVRKGENTKANVLIVAALCIRVKVKKQWSVCVGDKHSRWILITFRTSEQETSISNIMYKYIRTLTFRFYFKNRFTYKNVDYIELSINIFWGFFSLSSHAYIYFWSYTYLFSSNEMFSEINLYDHYMLNTKMFILHVIISTS